MTDYSNDFSAGARTTTTGSRVVRKIVGLACVIAVPSIWFAMEGALPEARIMGLALSVVLMGVAGLCFLGRR